MLELREVNIYNWKACCKITVSESDDKFVRSSEGILAKAYAYGPLADLYAVYVDEEAVGLILIRYYDEGKQYVLDQMMIDKRFQRRGIGSRAFDALMEILLDKAKYDSIILCYIEGNIGARNFYHYRARILLVQKRRRQETFLMFCD